MGQVDHKGQQRVMLLPVRDCYIITSQIGESPLALKVTNYLT